MPAAMRSSKSRQNGAPFSRKWLLAKDAASRSRRPMTCGSSVTDDLLAINLEHMSFERNPFMTFQATGNGILGASTENA